MADVAYSSYWSQPHPGSTARRYYRWKEGVRQKPFIKAKALPYLLRRGGVTQIIEGGYPTESVYGYDSPNDTLSYDMANRSGGLRGPYEECVNKSWARLKDAVFSDTASLGATLAEMGDSLNTIEKRGLQLYRSFRALRRGRFGDFIKELGVKRLKKHQNKTWSRPREASGLWLEYWFGWAPTIGDITTAIQVTASEIPSQTVHGSARREFSYRKEYSYGSFVSYKGIIRVKQGMQIKVSNPNALLANRLGLLNPVSVAWELVPFSFLIDWFVPVGNYLDSFTDFVGLEMSEQYTTVASKGTSHNRSRYEYGGNPPILCDLFAEHSHMRRTLGLTRPIVRWEAPLKLSATRAATAIALLISIFSPQRRS